MDPGEAMAGAEAFSLATCSVDMRFLSKDLALGLRLLTSVRGNILAKRRCRACDVSVEAADEGVVHYREEWESEEAFREHVQSEEFRRVLIAMDLCCEEPLIEVGSLARHGGMEYLRTLREPDPGPAQPRRGHENDVTGKE
jgi:quinol monooxygenase YgiN